MYVDLHNEHIICANHFRKAIIDIISNSLQYVSTLWPRGLVEDKFSKIKKTDLSLFQSLPSPSLYLSSSYIDSTPPNQSLDPKISLKDSKYEIGRYGLQRNGRLYEDSDHSDGVRNRRQFYRDTDS